MRTRRAIAALVAAASILWLASMVLGVSWNQGSGRAAPPLSTIPARVLGFLVADLTRAQGFGGAIAAKGHGIYAPNVHVYLRDATRGVIAKTVTDLSGRFEFHSVPAGRDQVCWKERGFLAGCTAAFAAGGTDRFLGNQLIRPALGTGRTTFYGRARFKDGSIPRTWEPMANVNAFVAIRAALGSHVTSSIAHVNNYGEYVLPGVAAPSKTRLVATIEHAIAQSLVGTPSPPLLRRVDFVLPNTPPKIAGIFGDSGSGHHWTALRGAKIKLAALVRDADSDPITVRWIFPDGTSTPPPAGGTATTFTLPNEIGTFQFHAVAYDGKGGYATDVVEISTQGVRFSGIVKATNAPFVAGATVAIGGRTTTTDAAGRFALVVKEAPRYVVDISKSGYQPVSAIYNTGILGGIWTLTRASVATFDPTQPIDATNRRISSDCPGSLSSQLKRRGKPKECGPGIRILIPANSLADAAGNPPQGPVDVALATVDLGAPDQMPGDYSVRVGASLDRMDSWGAGYVEITAGGTTYNLKPGATAEVVIPIAPEQLAAGGPMPNPIPLLTYDRSSGVWVPEGKAVRSGNTYVATVSHFSFLNIDVFQPNPACIRVDAVGMPPQFDLEVTGHDSTSGAPIVKTGFFDNSTTRFHVIGYVPPNDPNVQFRAFVHGTSTPITLALPNPTNIQPPPTSNVLVANSGPPSAGLPPFPYTVCRGFSGPTPGPLPSAVLVAATLPPNVVNEFLTGLGGGAENLTANPGVAGQWQAQAQLYYDTIDPLHKRQNIGDFRARNHFGTGEVTASYANSADLGFGREMHCQRHAVTGLPDFDVACYVTNYGNKDSDDFDDFVQALTGMNAGPLGTKPGAIATVGMEFSRIEDASDASGNTFVSNTRVVKFYVWAGPPTGSGSGNHLAAQADLDGFGARPVPQLCQTCHGGHFSGATSGTPPTPQWTPTSANLHSNFIAFDLRGLTTPTYLGTDYKAAQQAAFASLNKDIVDFASNRAVHDAIAKMYPGGTTTQDESPASVVNGWSSTSGSPSPHDFYYEVVAPSCRNCHMSQDTTAKTGTTPTPTFNDWDQQSELGAFAAGLVCEQNVMPNALITHRRFWLSGNPPPHQPLVFHDYMAAHGAGTAQIADCH